MAKKIAIIILIILGALIFCFIFIRPPVARMYCGRYAEKKVITQSEVVDIDKYVRAINSVYDNCLHRWGEK